MSSEIRVRRHTDGRVALHIDGAWLSIPGEWHKDASWCTGPSWSELLVAELPEPDGWTDAVDDNGEDVKTPLWRTSWGESVTQWIEIVETPVWELKSDLGEVRTDALKMLAAVAAYERYQQEIH